MSFLEYRIKMVPTGFQKVLHLNWALILLLTAVASVGWLMLYSVAGGNMETWAEPQMKRYAMGIGHSDGRCLCADLVLAQPVGAGLSGGSWACCWWSSFLAMSAWAHNAGSILASWSCNRPS